MSQKPSGLPKPTRLKVIDQRGFEKVVLIDKDVFPIGREAEGGLALVDDDPAAIAARHALVIRDGETFVLKDESGSCGTRVNGRPIRSAVLKHGDQITLGGSLLRILFLVEGTRASDFEEVRTRRLLEMLKELHSAQTPRDVCVRAAAGIMGLIGSSWAAIALCSDDGGLGLQAGIDRSGALPGEPSAIALHVAVSGRSYFHPARLCALVPGRVAPGSAGRGAAGVIDAGPRDGAGYKAADMELLEALADHVGVALANRRLERVLAADLAAEAPTEEVVAR